MNQKPYVGMTGFQSVTDVRMASKILDEKGLPKGYTAMFGVLTSDKRIANAAIAGKRSPAVNDIAKIVKAVPKEYIPMLHYFTRTPKQYADDVSFLFEESGCQNIQLNITWPSASVLANLKNQFPDMITTFQLPRGAIAGISEEELVSRLSEYSGLVEYALVDLSGGEGIEFSTSQAQTLLDILSFALPDVQKGIAGGLSGENVYHKVSSLQRPNIMFDAETGILTNNQLNAEKVREYIKGSLAL